MSFIRYHCLEIIILNTYCKFKSTYIVKKNTSIFSSAVKLTKSEDIVHIVQSEDQKKICPPFTCINYRIYRAFA